MSWRLCFSKEASRNNTFHLDWYQILLESSLKIVAQPPKVLKSLCQPFIRPHFYAVNTLKHIQSSLLPLRSRLNTTAGFFVWSTLSVLLIHTLLCLHTLKEHPLFHTSTRPSKYKYLSYFQYQSFSFLILLHMLKTITFHSFSYTRSSMAVPVF